MISTRTARFLTAAAYALDMLTASGRRAAWRRRARAFQAAAEQRYVPLEPIELAIAGTDVRVAAVQLGYRTVVTGELPPRGRHAAERHPAMRAARYGRAPVALAGYAARNGLRRPQDAAEAKGWCSALVATVPAAGVLVAVAALTLVSA